MHEPTFRRACRRGGAEPLPAARWPTSASTARGSTRTASRPPRRPSTSCACWWRRCKRNEPLQPDQGAGHQDARWSSAAASPASRPRWTSPTPATKVDPGRAQPVHRRPHVAAVRDLPHAGLLAVHPDAAHGRGGPAPEHHAATPTPKSRSLDGFVGNFKVTIRKKARSVDVKPARAAACAAQKCPTRRIPSEFDDGLGKRTAIYVPFPAGRAQQAGHRPRDTARTT